jgi:hypothetical protein
MKRGDGLGEIMIDDNVFLLLYGLGFLASFLSEGEWGKKRPGCVLSCIVCLCMVLGPW